MTLTTLYIVIVIVAYGVFSSDLDGFLKEIPPLHLPQFFTNNPHVKKLCQIDENCDYKDYTIKTACWGYEHNCAESIRYSKPSCLGDPGGWAKTKDEQLNLFYSQGDFGYIRDRKQELKFICSPENSFIDSSLECVDHLRYCRAKNILINFHKLKTMDPPMRYRMDVLSEGQIGGHCKLNIPLLTKGLSHQSPLQSWAPELRNFVKFASNPITSNKCDIIVEKPTYLMKLDATVNMYHHFCDFFNLYVSQHMNNSFSKDVFILLWDTMSYHSNFKATWKAFTEHPVLDLERFIGKKVCFRNLVLSFLPRMIYGMYYNMPLVTGCEGSGLFHAFTRHVLHRLEIKQNSTWTSLRNRRIRVTLLSRETSYRRILNENELIATLKLKPEFEVKKVNYNHKMPFYEQLQITHNTDVLIGIHGAGLTHLLFLPDWAVLFEIYNCEDDACYRDLANLRGVKYLTWTRKEKLVQQDQGHHPTLGAHAKFTNYAFDVDEFLRFMDEARQHVQNHPDWLRLHDQTNRDEL